jgi:hypothetical protein
MKQHEKQLKLSKYLLYVAAGSCTPWREQKKNAVFLWALEQVSVANTTFLLQYRHYYIGMYKKTHIYGQIVQQFVRSTMTGNPMWRKVAWEIFEAFPN